MDESPRPTPPALSNFWVDQIARQVRDREKALRRGLPLKTEMGIGASGIPHVGSAGDGVRSYAVHRALRELGEECEFIAFSDDLDGLRKVPIGLPAELRKYIGIPVSRIPDLLCKHHQSFGYHMTSLLQEAFDQIGVQFTLKRASEEYGNGTLDKVIHTLLTHSEQIGQIIKKLTGQTKYLEQLPYMPVCEKCGNVNTTVATLFDPAKNLITYSCSGSFIGKDASGTQIEIKGCGHSGTCGLRGGKLAWKSDFAARWAGLGITYEAYGKDIAESVAVNDAICKEVLDFEPPIHSFYELFTEKGGQKISKSKGNVFTPQVWLRYGPPESLRLLFLKKLARSRVVDPFVIPSYVSEVEELAAIYYGKQKTGNPKEEAHLKRLYEYACFLHPPREYPVLVPFKTMLSLARIVPEIEAVAKIGAKLAGVPEKALEPAADWAVAWVKACGEEEKEAHVFTPAQKLILKDVIAHLHAKKDPSSMIEIAKAHNLTAQDFFAVVYQALLGSPRGPRLNTLIEALGIERTAKQLRSAAGI